MTRSTHPTYLGRLRILHGIAARDLLLLIAESLATPGIDVLPHATRQPRNRRPINNAPRNKPMNRLPDIAFWLTVSILVAAIVAVALCAYLSSHAPATIVARVYAPASVGTGVSASGKIGVVFTPETWTLIVRGDEGSIYSLSTTADKWAAAQPGDRINDESAHRSRPSDK